MARVWLGIGLLVLFLVLGLWTGCTMEDMHTSIAQTLETAVAQTLEGDADNGLALARQAYADWQSRRHSTASMADHASMDDIDGLFAQTFCYAEAGNFTEFAAHCAQLARLVTAMGEAHTLTWWNLL